MISTSSSNWLDRLRSSRGFPTGDEPDLDRFISLSSSSGSAESATHVTATEKTPKWTPPSGEFATVLSDLFNMGGDVSKQQRKKACRKQPNPRFFNFDTELPTSSDDLRRNNNTNNHNNNTETTEKVGFNSTDDGRVNANIDSCCNDDNVGKASGDDNNNNNNRLVAVVVENNNEEEVENDELKEYSRSEVTVIDTSFDEWKSDKWVFRKNDDWKFKDKKKTRVKSKVSGFGSSNNNKNNSNTNKKKRKLLVSKLGDNSNSNKKLDDEKLKEKKEDDELPNKRQPRSDKGRDSFQKRQAYLGKVPQKRFPCPRPPEKQKNEESPVILIKSIPLNDNTAAMKTGKTSQKVRPKKMKII